MFRSTQNKNKNKGLTSWDDGMNILEQHQLQTMNLWYQEIFMGNLREGVYRLYYLKIGICIHLVPQRS